MRKLRHVICITATAFALLSAAVSTFGQIQAEQIMARMQAVTVSQYRVLPHDTNCVMLQMPFGAANFAPNQDVFSPYRFAQIDSIHLVYTQYPPQAQLNALHLARLRTFARFYADLFAELPITWRLVGQNGFGSRDEAEQLFHGLVVFGKRPPKDAYGREKRLYGGFKADFVYGLPTQADSAVTQMLNRMGALPDSAVLVCDLTASMYPFVIQLLRWQLLANQSYRFVGLVFFNDGDAKLTADKKIGATGGLYASDFISTDSVLRLMEFVKTKGDGGDLPENDVEAVLYASARFPSAKNLVLIADNESAIRDLAIATHITKPLHILLARTRFGLNLQYVRLAAQTGGSLHTAQASYPDMPGLKAAYQAELLRRKQRK